MEKEQLVFSVAKNPLFDIPISDINHCSSTRNDVGIRFNQYDGVSAEGSDLLVEMRFAAPSAEVASEFKKGISSKVCVVGKMFCF